VNLFEIFYVIDGVEYYLGYVLYNPEYSTIQKWWTFKHLKWAQLLNRLSDLGENLYGSDGFEYYLEYIVCSPGASTIPKWWTFKHLRWAQLLN
jgi:hypothetical protein